MFFTYPMSTYVVAIVPSHSLPSNSKLSTNDTEGTLQTYELRSYFKTEDFFVVLLFPSM